MKDWSTLEKGDKLFILVPFWEGENGQNFKYVYQESQVINVHHYDWCTNIRFKYTDHCGKRRRLELGVNKLKYKNEFVSADSKTSWAREVPIKFQDLIITFIDKDKLNKAYQQIIDNEIMEVENNIDKQKKKLSSLQQMKYNTIV